MFSSYAPTINKENKYKEDDISLLKKLKNIFYTIPNNKNTTRTKLRSIVVSRTTYLRFWL